MFFWQYDPIPESEYKISKKKALSFNGTYVVDKNVNISISPIFYGTEEDIYIYNATIDGKTQPVAWEEKPLTGLEVVTMNNEGIWDIMMFKHNNIYYKNTDLDSIIEIIECGC